MIDQTAKHDWFRIALAIVAVSAAFALPLTYFVSEQQPADVPVLLRWGRPAVVWLMFTLLLAGMFAAGVWRMAGRNRGDRSDISPMKALVMLASVIGICALSVVPVFLFEGLIDTKMILYGSLALCVAVVLALYFWKGSRSA